MLDVHPAPAGEVEQPLPNPGGALEPTGAPGHRLALGADDRDCHRTGTFDGIDQTFSAPVRAASTGPTTSGITSPARRTIT